VYGTALPLSEWLARLETISSREIDLGLERVARVLDKLALPQARRVFHIAGTNGKGSSVAMLESMLRGSGARIGCYTSPHISEFNERIRIDGKDASDEQIISAFERVEAVRGDEELTYFEFSTLAALVVFADTGMDTLILEVGMGGRLDAVNAVEPTAGLITNIALDHCAWLGETIEAIAFEKAGIMRPDKPVVFGAREVPRAILGHASDINARLQVAGRDYDWQVDGETWSWRGQGCKLDGLATPALAGKHQVSNAAAVLALLEAVGATDVLQADKVSAALGNVRLDGRIQEISNATRWIVDVAHNPAAAEVLGRALSDEGHNGQTIAIVGMLDDKDVEGVVAHLQPHVDKWIAVAADSHRAISADELARRVANETGRACLVGESLESVIELAEELAGSEDRVLLTGSFYLVGPALKQLYSRRYS
jgi:dihydrofolate synthase/folylpolyglutamate synthase